ncbi:hypothetical protein NLI96_g861 [Meripilus lineatus]|uniref:Uncharacterized protein n=1 Tax=Meripilus lineatus TaxID=2056292 RepID=A0AAD5YNE5_9APHY|nr:hypothetical protein NLI96_g861 [Physisporinus lineatus]
MARTTQGTSNSTSCHPLRLRYKWMGRRQQWRSVIKDSKKNARNCANYLTMQQLILDCTSSQADPKQTIEMLVKVQQKIHQHRFEAFCVDDQLRDVEKSVKTIVNLILSLTDSKGYWASFCAIVEKLRAKIFEFFKYLGAMVRRIDSHSPWMTHHENSSADTLATYSDEKPYACSLKSEDRDELDYLSPHGYRVHQNLWEVVWTNCVQLKKELGATRSGWTSSFGILRVQEEQPLILDGVQELRRCLEEYADRD